MRRRSVVVATFVALGTMLVGVAGVAEENGAVASLGAATYLTRRPEGVPGPPPPSRLPKGHAGPVPTNRYWSSLLTGDAPLPHYPHPLAVHACERGLRVQAPPVTIDRDKRGFSAMLAESGRGEDLALSSASFEKVTRIALEEASDSFVRLSLASDAGGFDVTYGEGSPYVFATFGAGGGARLDFSEDVTLWSGGAKSATLGITVRGRHYGLFGPRGSTWRGLDGKTWINEPGAARHFSLALLPAATDAVLALFARHAHAHVTGSRGSWAFSPKSSVVKTTFELDTRALEGDERETLVALYPHQWAHTGATLLPGIEYRTVRGTMKVVRGTSFTTEHRFPGLLPALPPVEKHDAERVRRLLADEVARANGPALDAYFEGKLLGRLATQVPLAEAFGEDELARRLVAGLEKRLEKRFRALDPAGKPKTDRLEYDRTWGALIARPQAFHNDDELNDHHLQFGYYLRAAAEIAARDAAWVTSDRYGGAVRLIARDVASADRRDPLFPFLRSFDLYAGHSWASGLARYASGNDLESSSESMNCWSALALLGHALGDTALRDLGVALFTIELSAIEEYWLDVERRNFPADFEPPAVALVWGGRSRLETWFSEEPEALFGINWLPFHGGSLYLGRYPDSARRVHEAVRARRGSSRWGFWPDLVIMHRALSSPDDAAEQLERFGETFPEQGNSRLNLEHWVRALRVLGTVDRETTSDALLHGTFVRDGRKVHVAYRLPHEPASVVTFSDGATLRLAEPGFTTDLR